MHNIVREYAISREEIELPDMTRIRAGIDLQQLEAALALSVYGSFRKAADALNMKPTTVNRRIRDLEFLLGAAIFERNKRRAVPTRTGSIVLRHAGQLLASFQNMIEGVRRISDGKAGQIAIGFSGPIFNGPFYDLIFSPPGTHPDIEILPVELKVQHLQHALSMGIIDVALFRGELEQFQGSSYVLGQDPVLACLPVNHPLAGRPHLDWTDIAKEPLVLSRGGASGALETLARQKLGTCNPAALLVAHDIGDDAVVELCKAGHGIALCLGSTIPQDVAGCVSRQIVSQCCPEQLPMIAYLRNDGEPAALERLFRKLTALVTKPSPLYESLCFQDKAQSFLLSR